MPTFYLTQAESVGGGNEKTSMFCEGLTQQRSHVDFIKQNG